MVFYCLNLKQMTELLSIKNLSKHYNKNDVLSNISLSIHDAEFISILGPSGCGKTSLLKLISGFETPNSGEIFYNNEPISHLPPQKRNIHTVFQDYALFPHLSVYENIAFSLRAQGVNKKEIDERVLSTLTLVKLFGLNSKYPSQLSGGQQQRVAIARAIINKPKLILLDESLSALDASLRKAMQIELKQLQRSLGITFIYVTHSQEEALSMSERVIIMGKGKIQQVGTPREIYETPKNLFVATFVGESNVFNTKVLNANAETIEIKLENNTFILKNTADFKKNDPIHCVIRSEDWQIYPNQTPNEIKETLQGVILEVIYKGSTVDLLIQLASGKIISATEFFNEEGETLNYKIGETVGVDWINGWEVVLPYEN